MNSSDWLCSLFSSIDAKDTERFLGFLADDAAFRFGNGPIAEGKAAIGAAVDGFFATIRASRHDVVRTWMPPGHCICHGSVTYTRLDGSTITMPFANILGMRDGLINDYLIYIDPNPLFA
ncbi:MAG: nuclear transport factor 2 family protein [Dokdonella sp.]